MGKRMFEQGEASWPEDVPFHVPVYVLTHETREPWVRPGGILDVLHWFWLWPVYAAALLVFGVVLVAAQRRSRPAVQLP